MRISLGAAAAILCLISGQALGQSMTCLSSNNDFTRCDLPEANALHVQILKTTAGNCDQDGAWGADSQGIWVNKGCGGVFLYNAPTPGNQSSSLNSDDEDVLVAPPIVDDPAYYVYDPDGGYYYNNYNGDCTGDGGCHHYKNGYQAGLNDAKANVQSNYANHQGQFDADHEADFARGYSGGFHGGGGGGRR
jgi:hypothetical protein